MLQDLISFADFAIGAMENWGLLTFRERFLMYDEAQSSAGAKLDVAIVVAHEVAHQWFGNLVTLEWWTGRLFNRIKKQPQKIAQIIDQIAFFKT